MAYIFNPTPLTHSQYEAEWAAIQAEVEQRYNEATNWVPDTLWHPYDEPVWMPEAYNIFRRRFGITVTQAVYGWNKEQIAYEF